MNEKLTVSEQLRRRRREAGLSLSEVARRAGTSAATLSRYENGWTRFETYTLQKLATALGCELHIEIRPGAAGPAQSASRADAVKRLRRLFWDRSLTEADLDRHSAWVLERVLEYGDLADVRLMRDVMGDAAFLRAAAGAARLSPRALNFWHQILKREGIQCTKRKFCRNTVWNC